MTKEDKKKIFAPKPFALYENGCFITVFPSHSKAKAAKHRKIIEANQDLLDFTYELKPYNPEFL